MKKTSVEFRFFPREAVKEDNFFLNFLQNNFEITLSKDAEVILFSNFSENRKEIPIITDNATKVFWTGENLRMDMKKCDYAFGFDYEEEVNNKNYLRFPLYSYYGAGENLIKGKNYSPKKVLESKTKFCNYAYSKDAKGRVDFFTELSKYKKIDAPGKSMNNSSPIIPKSVGPIIVPVVFFEKIIGKYTVSSLMSRHLGNWRQDVINFEKDYKFTIAFENSSYPGYTTEKIYHPMLANSIPIYWGNPEIGREFNTKSFINWHDYNDNKKVADLVAELDTNNKKYLKILSEPWLNKNKINKWMDKSKIKRQFEKILNQKAKK